MDDVMKGKRWSRNPYSGDKYDVDNMSFKEWKEWTKDIHLLKMNEIVTQNGIKINGVAKHLEERMFERSVDAHTVIDALIHPFNISDIRVDNQGRETIRYIGKDTTVYINPNNGILVTTHKTSSSKRKKYMQNDKNK